MAAGQTLIRRVLPPAIAVVLLALPAAAAPRRTEDTRRSLEETERLQAQQSQAGKAAAERATRASAEAARLTQQRVTAATRLQQADTAVQTAAARIDALAAQRRQAEEHLRARAAALQPLLPLIERLSLYPVETLLATPEDPEGALRGILVLKGLSHTIEVDAEALRHDQEAVDAATAALQAEQPRLAEAAAAQKHEAAALDAQIAAAHAADQTAEADAADASAQAAQTAARADSLRSALAGLEAEQRAAAAKARTDAERAERQKRLADAQAARQREAIAVAPAGDTASMKLGAGAAGQLQPPVVGVVVQNWGQQTDSGPATGLSYHAPPGARVVAPCGGRVVFADTFRSYGLLMIIDCGGGYHVVLAGFDRLDVRLGQSLVAGEPVGVMPSWEPGSSGRRPALYVELRHAGQPVNPAPWLRSSS